MRWVIFKNGEGDYARINSELSVITGYSKKELMDMDAEIRSVLGDSLIISDTLGLISGNIAMVDTAS